MLSTFPLFASYDLSALRSILGPSPSPEKRRFCTEDSPYPSHPETTVTILPGTLPIRSLSSILGATPQIPDVMIFPCTRGLKTREVAGVIAPLCRAIDPVITVRTGERDGLPFSAPYFVLNTLTGRSHILGVFGWCLFQLGLSVPLCLGFCASLISASVWLGCDLEWTVGSMHIQAISVPDGSRFTLSTFRMSVTPVPQGFFTAFHLADTLEHLKSEEDSDVSLVPLLEFIHRHPSIHELTLACGALLSASLVPSAGLQSDPANITILSSLRPGIIFPIHLALLARRRTINDHL
ncbi:hypothetical protein B0H13DRAFT_2335444 [Mycena leptocephala]|nr:hypothetical protein B0H13DRAFT_2335444 [Mycena leptocephala]